MENDKSIAVLTSGGDSPGMNSALRAVVRYGIYLGYKVFGVQRGYEGLVQDNMFEMDRRSVSDILHRGGTILKTARLPEFTKIEVQKVGYENLSKRGIKNLVVIGGDGSFRGAKELSDNFGVNVVGIPATIDNDLAYTDYTIGFDTAVNTVLWAINNLRDTMTSHDRVCIIEVMGRSCGDIALHSALAGGAEGVLIPELPVDFDKIANQLKENYLKGKTSNIILLSEGVGKAETVKAIIKEKTGIQVRTSVLGHIQRGGSPSNMDRVYGALLGKKAVDLVFEGKSNRVVGVKNNGVCDMDITEALNVKAVFNVELYETARILSL